MALSLPKKDTSVEKIIHKLTLPKPGNKSVRNVLLSPFSCNTLGRKRARATVLEKEHYKTQAVLGDQGYCQVEVKSHPSFACLYSWQRDFKDVSFTC